MAEPGDRPSPQHRGRKAAAAFRTISEVAADLDLPQHVLRFWETKFTAIKPMKRGGGRRYYRPEDVALIRQIRDLLYSDGYTIKGVQKLLREGGGKLAGVGAKTEIPAQAEEKAAPAPLAPDATAEDAALRAELESVAAELEDIRSLILSAAN